MNLSNSICSRYSCIATILSVFICISSVFSQDMDNQRMDEILKENIDSLHGVPGFWQFEIDEIPVMIITDETHNRMRIISPIMDMDYVTEEQLQHAMMANFHTALDVRYAVSEGLMWSAYIHPLKELSSEQFLDGLQQAHLAAKTFGTSYHSTDLSFPSSGKEEEESKPKEKKI